jgi:rod shape determining protein RodA
MLLYSLGITAVALLFSEYVIRFDIVTVQLCVTGGLVVFLLYNWLSTRFHSYLFILLFAIGSVSFFYSADYVLNNVLEAHQRTRINVLLGLDEDLAGAGYNVHQSEIAIGSGGLVGKGLLNGTITKADFVPEQETDFIFCTVGEEWGFVGGLIVVAAYVLLLIRLIFLAERQRSTFARFYGYSVASILFFHFFINIGMVLGLVPVIGIPLPFFSYGGSSLIAFTLLLFIFIRQDADRNALF